MRSGDRASAGGAGGQADAIGVDFLVMEGDHNKTLRMAAGEWHAAGNPSTRAEVWLVSPPVMPIHCEADVYREDEKIETLTAPTHEELIQELDRRYGSCEGSP